MIILGINMHRELLETFFKGLVKLPLKLIPNLISDDEAGTRVALSSDVLRQGNDLLIDGKSGYFLYAPNLKYGVSFLGNDARFLIEAQRDEDAKAILEFAASIPINYAYACDFEEREHQNRIESKKSYGTEQIWVGRDFNRYLPGLYWLNIIPKLLLEKHRISEKSIFSLAQSFHLINDQNYFIQLYSSPYRWVDRVKEVDCWRNNTPGVFSKTSVEQALKKAQTFSEVSSISGKWQ